MKAFDKELEPCPFCGEKAYFCITKSHSCGYSAGFDFEVQCNNCKVSLPDTYHVDFKMKENGDIQILNDGRIEAVKKWNKRIKKKGAAQDEQA